MSARVHQARSNEWQSSIAASFAGGFSVVTKDPSLSVAAAPMAVLDIVFGGRSNGAFAAARRAISAPSAVELPTPARVAPVVSASELPAAAPVVSASELPAAASLVSASEPPAAAPSPSVVAPPADAADLDLKAAEPRESSNQIELIIDSLSHHMLTEPIPVTIDPLGNSLFTASVRYLDMSATGNSISEAFMGLKEQIEEVYDNLNKRAQLTTEQKTTLQMLHTYIAPQLKKPEWP